MLLLESTCHVDGNRRNMLWYSKSQIAVKLYCSKNLQLVSIKLLYKFNHIHAEYLLINKLLILFFSGSIIIMFDWNAYFNPFWPSGAMWWQILVNIGSGNLVIWFYINCSNVHSKTEFENYLSFPHLPGTNKNFTWGQLISTLLYCTSPAISCVWIIKMQQILPGTHFTNDLSITVSHW